MRRYRALVTLTLAAACTDATATEPTGGNSANAFRDPYAGCVFVPLQNSPVNLGEATIGGTRLRVVLGYYSCPDSSRTATDTTEN